MSRELLAADTRVWANQDLIDHARNHFGGRTPLFWGRYFKHSGREKDYQPTENAVLSANHIRVLPIAGQTASVGGSASEGAEDARFNVRAFIDNLGVEHVASVGGELLMFLAVDGTPDSPNLSVDYWMGWSGALVEQSRRMLGGRTTIIPAIYCRQDQKPTWEAIARADDLGFPCAGAWVWRTREGACQGPVPSWDAAFNTPKVELPCPVMIWKFAYDCMPFEGGTDFDMINPDPAIATALLNRLILPPR